MRDGVSISLASLPGLRRLAAWRADWRRMAASLALLALLLHSFLPLLHHAAMRLQTASQALDSIVICTANGFRTVQVDAEGRFVDHAGAQNSDNRAPAPEKTQRYCPVCLQGGTPHQPGPALLPLLASLPLPLFAGLAEFAARFDNPAIFAVFGPAQARAPPFLP